MMCLLAQPIGNHVSTLKPIGSHVPSGSRNVDITKLAVCINGILSGQNLTGTRVHSARDAN